MVAALTAVLSALAGPTHASGPSAFEQGLEGNFRALCLDAFPSPTAIAGFAAANKLRRTDRNERSVTDGIQATWVEDQSDGGPYGFAVAIGKSRICDVGRVVYDTSNIQTGFGGFGEEIDRQVARVKGSRVVRGSPIVRHLASGATSTISPLVVIAGTGRPTDVFMLTFTYFPDPSANSLAVGGAAHGDLEVMLSRQSAPTKGGY